MLRDYGAPGRPEGLAFVVTHEDVGERYPSTVVVEKGALYFGPQAEARRAQRGAKVWDSLKANAAVKNGWAEAAGCDDLALRDLVTLSLAHYIFLAYECAKRHAALLDAKPNMALTLGAPVIEAQGNNALKTSATEALVREVTVEVIWRTVG